MNDAIIALFLQHGPMTASEAMARGLGAICNTCIQHNAQYRLNLLLKAGRLRRHTERRHLAGGVGSLPRRTNVFVYQVRPQ